MIDDGATVRPIEAASVGAVTGFMSGLTGTGGGVFLAPMLIGLGWGAPRHAVGMSAPFILASSIVARVGTVLVGQVPAPDTALLAPFALLAAAAGTAIGL
ncbi:TSUP family transporter [Methylobacterium sp. BTF04]|uniref:TSUP family transporter n=1 Tax=Methylobacterium sp. BTF04 TaxID=2708300 RepID=UPI0013D86CFB|nr:TSUP family transporter [Methylobacterium sp. BTF04]NEU13693.1 TSUP family transporter [Methylobacterium sp. BTF04]